MDTSRVEAAAVAILRATVGVLGLYLVLLLAAPVVLAWTHRDVIATEVWTVLLDRPAALGAVGCAALAAGFRPRLPGWWWCIAAAALVLAVSWDATQHLVSGAGSAAGLLWALGAVAVVAVLGELGRVPRPLGFAKVTLLATVALAVWLLGFGAPAHTTANRLGLASGIPTTSTVVDYANHPLKDDYPPCTIENNSLGYRDVEPAPGDASRRRVLLVGDSFVWGDGIASSQDTLGALLRRNLETRAPGAWAVVTAAYPGLGAYGYRRAIERMATESHPDVVIVGWLGEPDLDPLDVQALVDLLPRSHRLYSALVKLRTMQDLHEASMTTLRSPAWQAAFGTRWRDALFAWLRAFAETPGRRSILICYDGCRDRIPGIEALRVPPRLRYPGHRNEYWYEKDNHPKAPLNRLIAEALAARLTGATDVPDDWHAPGGTPAGRSSDAPATRPDRPPALAPPRAPDAAVSPVIAPGQEPLILAMLGGAREISGCVLVDARVERDHIEASYSCSGGRAAVVMLQQRTRAGRDAIVTKQFSLRVATGDVPAEFLGRVASGVRLREDQFRWLPPVATPATAPHPGFGPPPPPHPRPWRAFTGVLIGLALALASLIRRRTPGVTGTA